jgi:oligopeptide transport system substrate-binding protein
VKLDRIMFYPLDEQTTIMNLYKAGEVDAVLNHTPPAPWVDSLRGKKDFVDMPEAAIEFYTFNTKKPPMNDVRVRKAFNAAVDKAALAHFKRTAKPLTAFTPEGIFPGYPQPKGDPFDPEQARKLLGEAGFPVTKQGDNTFQCKGFPVGEVEYIFNTNSSNKSNAEYMQAQWKQNLGITVPLRSMEFKTFLPMRNKLEFKGFAIGLWSADYMDPFTFLGLFSTPDGTNGSGWFDPKYVAMLNEANRTLNPQKRYELLAEAEKYLLDNQPVIPIETFAVNWLKKPYVKGMYPNAASLYPWKFVYIERDSSKWDYGVPSLSDK